MREVVRSELILGGQRSGKSRRAETLAQRWLADSSQHRAVMIATGQAWDGEMRERIEQHRRDRALRLPGMRTVEEPLALADALRENGAPDTLLVVDCLTLWLTNLTMPVEAAEKLDAYALHAAEGDLLRSIHQVPGPVVLVSNEIGLGVVPLGRQVRDYVDALGRLNQSMAGVCQRVTLMAAGLCLKLKEPA